MEKYLIDLLETNNRVIVPDLGAFIIRQQEPQELVFNDLLAFNDGMLTSHIKQLEGISMSKAQVKIEEFVDQVKKVLTQGDIYHLENLGYLKMDDSSKIEFSVSPFPGTRAEIVSSTILGQDEKNEDTIQPEEETREEIPESAEEESLAEKATVSEVSEVEDVVPEVPAEEDVVPEMPAEEDVVPEVPAEEDIVPEVPDEEDMVLEIPEEEDIVLEVPKEETPDLGWPDDEDVVPKVPVEEAPEKETFADIDHEIKGPEGNLPEDKVEEEMAEAGPFTLEDQATEIEVDASEDAPLIPDPEEPPFLIEDQEAPEEKKAPVVGTSQARLEAAAEAAVDDEKKAQELVPESITETEASIPYYVEGEKKFGNIWPWVGGAAALIIILLVAAWFFFPDEVNRILAGKSADTVTTELAAPDKSSGPIQEASSDSPEAVADTEEDQGEITGDGDATGSDAAEETVQVSEEVQPEVETVKETPPEPEPVIETTPAGQAKKYYIVAGMFSIRANAEDHVNDLKTKGYDAELFGRHNNLYGVAFSSHESKTAAVQEMNRIREQSNPQAWLLYY